MRKRGIGRLIAIGGKEDLDEQDMHILPRVAKLAGGRDAHLLVCAVASEEPGPTLRAYRKVFERLGATVDTCSFRDRRDGEQPQTLALLEKATGVFFTGGNQLRITSIMAGTRFEQRLMERFEHEGLLVAGTSAGAAVLSETMISGGEGGTVRRSDVEMAPGLGFWRDVVVDTHFDRSGRVHRLMAVFAQNPGVLGIGLDEDTAVEVEPGKGFTVLGRKTVIVFDGRVSHSNAARVERDDPLALFDCVVHVLSAGYRFDLQQMRPEAP